MPFRPPSICPCGHRVPPGTKCACAQKRERERKEQHERQRPSARQRGYTSKWQKASAAFLARPENRCCACGCGRSADMVDHRIAHKGDMRLFWAQTNWQPYNSLCNRRKAIREEGAFGREKIDQGTRGVAQKVEPTGDRRMGLRAQLFALKKGNFGHDA